MASASETYLAGLAEQFLASQTAIGWRAFAASDLKGETTWIDPTSDQPGVEVEINYRRFADVTEVEVIAYEPDDDGQAIISVRRVGEVRK